jgi:hypothetical protein
MWNGRLARLCAASRRVANSNSADMLWNFVIRDLLFFHKRAGRPFHSSTLFLSLDGVQGLADLFEQPLLRIWLRNRSAESVP